MSSQKLYIDLEISGQLTDAYSVTLASASGTYGVRTQAGTVVVPNGTSVLHPSIGRYEYTLDAIDSEIYVVSWKVINQENDQPVYVDQTVGPFVTTSSIQAVADYRGTFLQGKTTTLMLKVTDFDGQSMDPRTISLSIFNENNEVETTGVPDKVANGFFIYDWAIPATQAVGPYTAVWTYTTADGSFTAYQGIVVIQDGNTAVTDGSLYAERLSAIRTSLDYHLAQAQAIPVYDAEGIVAEDLKTVRFTFPRWNQNHRTRIYRNGKIVTSGVTINYFKGEVSFDAPLHPTLDRVTADYNFRWFKDEELDRFLSNGLHIVNLAPPAKSYFLQTVPDSFLPAILYGAAVDALRHLILDLQFQEPQEVFGGPEMARNAASMLETLKQNYEKTFELLLGYKKLGPYTGLTRLISVPEYTLPGGRSRWFRYMMGGFNL